MPLYRLTAPGLPVEVLAADRLARESLHSTIFGTALLPVSGCRSLCVNCK